VIAAVAALAACESSSAPPRAKPGDEVIAVAPKPVDAGGGGDAAARKVFINSAGRCGECHEKMFDEWEPSAHADAADSPVYLAALADAGDDPTCDRCHVPLAREAPGNTLVREGVTCDVCHTLRDPTPSADGAGFRLAVDDMVKYGPRCNLEDHYFHRMGCSREHRQAELCGACHQWEPKGLPVLTEYTDWKAGPYPAQDAPCQACHMPTSRAALAQGAPVRPGVPHHGLLGAAGDLRRRALALEVRAADDAGTLAVTVTLRNTNAGHAVPAGLPERRVVVGVRVRDAAGAERASASRALGRVLVDATGAEAPFWRATRVGADSRIPPGGTWTETFALGPFEPGTIEVEVVHRDLTEAAARRLPASVEVVAEVMAQATLALKGPTPPRPVVVSPPPVVDRSRATAHRRAP